MVNVRVRSGGAGLMGVVVAPLVAVCPAAIISRAGLMGVVVAPLVAMRPEAITTRAGLMGVVVGPPVAVCPAAVTSGTRDRSETFGVLVQPPMPCVGSQDASVNALDAASA
jgi:hypothetical protein